MENVNEINEKIARNLVAYRKLAKMTQAELAEKINYSDKSVSKWESGNGVPDVYTLLQIARVYGVTLNDLVGEETPVQENVPPKKRGMRIMIMLLSSGIVWLVATCIFVLIQNFAPNLVGWMSFIYAIPINAIVLIALSGSWNFRTVNLASVSILIWTALVCVFLSVRLIARHNGWDYEGAWTVFLLGIPLQILEFLWTFFRVRARKIKMQMLLNEEAKQKEEKRKEDEKQKEEKQETEIEKAE